ncbi:DDRGK domain-containing protein 1 isoform X1 [Callorhinchus milii]|nr:DDRGK domain-containing protein 1 isoform X1 [Callorhinchus milii]|eukprot:gi/632960445/ref/XP_007896199.1/ PREDICTED: DDRGK domain-containing protein 1 isoform X1 [Callorhinchus milii]
MDPVLYVLAAVAIAILILFVSRIRRQVREADRDQQQDVAGAVGRPRPLNEDRAAGMPRVRRNMRNRFLARRAQEAEVEREAAETETGTDDPELPTQGKIGAKKQRKLDEKEQRRAQREVEEAEREERKKLQAIKDEERKKDEERMRVQEQKKEEELRKTREEKERRDHEEYLRLKESFVIEAEGQDELMMEHESTNLLQEFIDYIKSTKVVLLEDLGSHFGLKTQDAINRLQDLIAEGTVTGVLDDRGKFIYITPQELEAVAQFIRFQGRVSIVELARVSNSLINLNPATNAAPENVAQHSLS